MMKPVHDPAKQSKEALSYEKHPKRPPREAKAADPPKPDSTNVKFDDDRLTPEQVEQRFKFFDVKTVPDSFFAIICAPRRNGKSEMLQSMLEDFRKCKDRKFSHIFLFSQTGAGYKDQIPPSYRFQDLRHVPEICSQQLQVKRFNEKAKRKEQRVTSRTLLVLDDMIGEEKGPDSLRNSGIIRKLAVGGRHLGDNVPGNGISVIILTQSMKAIPKVVRQNADFCACGKLASRVERETYVYEQLALRSDRDGIKQAYAVFDGITYSAPYRFIICCNWIQTRMTHEHYVSFYNATYPVKQHHMFGDINDWLEEEEPPSIFDLEM